MNFKKLKQQLGYAIAFTLVLLITNNQAHGQIEKGLFQVGGSASFFSNNVETNSNFGNPQKTTNKNSNVSFGPAFGYFVSNNLSLGIQLGYGTNENENNDFNSTLNSFQYGIYSRWHKPVVERFYFFTSLSLLLANGENEVLDISTGTTTKADISNFSANLAPGLLYFVTDWLSFETSLNLMNYSTSKAETEDNNFTQNTDNFNFNLNLTNLNLGMVFYF